MFKAYTFLSMNINVMFHLCYVACFSRKIFCWQVNTRVLRSS